MAKVYAIQEANNKNMLSATNFGDLEILLPPQSNLMFSTEKTLNTIKSGLDEFTEDDYLLLIGDPVSIGIATHYATKKTDVVKFLKWDNREYTYFPVEVKFR
jgi:hypothetical protein